MLFQAQEKELRQVAMKASEFARKENHKDAARMRRLTRHTIWKTDPHIERILNIVFAWLAFIATAGILLYIKLF